MLIKRVVLDRIATGEIDVLFRKWRRPTVRSGGQLRTSIGMLDIIEVERVAVSTLRAADAHRAGYATKAALLKELESRTEGEVFRIAVRAAGADPRIALRDDADLSDDDRMELDRRLARIDAASTTGDWTGSYLDLLDRRPHVRAQDLADELGVEMAVLKTNVRKLKALGLTISHSPGYELSPRGRAYLRPGDLGEGFEAG